MSDWSHGDASATYRLCAANAGGSQCNDPFVVTFNNNQCPPPPPPRQCGGPNQPRCVVHKVSSSS
jgi:hypothetical protein